MLGLDSSALARLWGAMRGCGAMSVAYAAILLIQGRILASVALLPPWTLDERAEETPASEPPQVPLGGTASENRPQL